MRTSIFVACAVIAACSSPAQTTDAGSDAGADVAQDSPADSAPTTCTSNADCPAKTACGFKTSDACNAVGTCVPVDIGAGACDAGGALVCDCSGQDHPAVACQLPSGYLYWPIAHDGPCATDAGVD